VEISAVHERIVQIMTDVSASIPDIIAMATLSAIAR
jgi:hypothetical protein